MRYIYGWNAFDSRHSANSSDIRRIECFDYSSNKRVFRLMARIYVLIPCNFFIRYWAFCCFGARSSLFHWTSLHSLLRAFSILRMANCWHFNHSNGFCSLINVLRAEPLTQLLYDKKNAFRCDQLELVFISERSNCNNKTISSWKGNAQLIRKQWINKARDDIEHL